MTPAGQAAADRALRSILGGQARVFEELAEVVSAQREAVLAGDPVALEQLAARGQTLATRFAFLERERERLDAEIPAPPASEERRAAEAALARLLRETALLRGVVSRVGEVVSLRSAAVLSALGEVYLPSGRLRDEGTSRGSFDVGV